MEEKEEADVVIIGAGITGCAVARQLSKYKLNVLVLEREDDISCGTTKSNNGMIIQVMIKTRVFKGRNECKR